MLLLSPSFNHGQNMPAKYSSLGLDISPPLVIRDVPENTSSLALILDDPDAKNGTLCHWLMWNIPPDTSLIKEGKIPKGTVQGKNGFNEISYHGPNPPTGEQHGYFFRLYALNDTLDLLPEVTTHKQLNLTMGGRIITSTQLMARFEHPTHPLPGVLELEQIEVAPQSLG